MLSLNWKLTLDWNDKLWDDRENLSTTLLKHVKNTLNGKEAVGVLLFTDTFKEDG